MARKLPILLAAALLATLAGAAAASAGAASGDKDKMTICHVPPGNPEAARTMRIPRSAWHAHEGHGDHEGACTDADRRAPPAPPGKPQPPQWPPTRLSIAQRADGDLDGGATFRVDVANEGPAPAIGVRVDGALRGDGAWSLRASHYASCDASHGRLACDLADVPAGTTVTLWLSFHGALSVCREAATDLAVSAANDESGWDDRSQARARTGACAASLPPA